jgi:hypothetical protein
MKPQQADYDEYRTMALFAGCTPAAVRGVTGPSTRVWFAPGKELATQRRPCRQFALIVDGTVG